MPPPSYELLPFDGLAEARLGEGRACLRPRLGAHRTFRKGVTQMGLTDHYVDRGLILHHDHRDRLSYIEVCDAEIRYRGVQLLARPYGRVREDLAALGCRGVEDAEESGCAFPDLGFTLWAGGDSDPDAEVEMVGLFGRGQRGAIGGFVRGTGAEPRIRHHVLVPHEGTEQVRLGADRHALRRLLGTCLESVPEYGAHAEDGYIEHGLTLGFDSTERLVSVAVASLARTVNYQGVQLLGRPYEDVVADLAGRDVPVEQGELIGRAPGFALLLAGDDGPHLPVASVRVAAE